MELLTQILRSITDRHVSLIAAGVAFYSFFAIFPGMAAIIAIWGLFSDPVVMREYLSQTHSLLPDMVFSVLSTQLDALLGARPHTLGWASLLSLAVALYSVHNGVSALISAVNAIQGHKPRGGVRGLIASIAMTAFLIVIAVCALGTVVVLPIVMQLVPLGQFAAPFLHVAPWVILLAVVLVSLGLFYRWGSNPTGRRHSWLSPGSVLATALWVASSVGFSIYLANFGAYNRIYGSIGAIVALLMWFWISAYIVLLGATLNAELWRRKDQ
ncbi:MAG: YihY/virulence factor BrkB family protein [Rhodobacteraceae bacterium]|nr:YihY/virulence factor BrkB family protein [Paracoccaceae bacterium]